MGGPAAGARAAVGHPNLLARQCPRRGHVAAGRAGDLSWRGAAMYIATGRVIGKCYARHRAVEFHKLLDEIETAVPSDLDVHLVIDNYAAHKAPAESTCPGTSPT